MAARISWKKTIISFAAVFLFACLFAGRASALDIISRAQMGIDDSLVLQDDNYLQADSIVITPIYLEGGEFVSDYDWYKGLFYFQTVRLNQGDFLFHYVVSKSGQIFKGVQKGEEHRFLFTEEETLKPIVIAYFSAENDIEFDPVSKSPLSELILDIANRNSIPMDRVFVKSIEFIAKPNEAISARFGMLGGKWERTLKEMTNVLKPLYNPTPKQFDLVLSKVELPSAAVNYGDNVVMSLTITNNSDYILLKGNSAEPIITLSGSNSSKFFLNGVWSSLSQIPVFGDAEFLKPGQEKIFQIRLFVPLYFGLVKENFYLTDTAGKKYSGSDFEVALTVNRLDKKVIEIVNTKQLNVRDNPWYNAGIVNRVTEGSRFIVLEETNDGWLRLELPNNKTGWVVRMYTKVV